MYPGGSVEVEPYDRGTASHGGWRRHGVVGEVYYAWYRGLPLRSYGERTKAVWQHWLLYGPSLCTAHVRSALGMLQDQIDS